MTSTNKHHSPYSCFKSLSILVLDDDFDIATTIKLGLQEHDFDVYSFTDPYLALKHFKMNATIYGLVISDFKMPRMNGFEFTRKVKETKPDVKVFLMTSFDINSLEFSGHLPSSIYTIDEFIQKPISIRNLIIIVRMYINRI